MCVCVCVCFVFFSFSGVPPMLDGFPLKPTKTGALTQDTTILTEMRMGHYRGHLTGHDAGSRYPLVGLKGY